MKDVEVVYRRGGRTESVHRVRVAVVEGKKKLLAAGDTAEDVFMRSAAKPFQALAVVESGAVDAFRLSEDELAIVCGSHGADEVHVTAVTSILEKARLEPAALRCGAHPPTSPRALKELYRSGAEPSALHNNCSGKHAGMLAAAKRLGAPLDTYLDPKHPLQKANAAAVARFCGVKAVKLGTDGCSAPNFAVPLMAMARAMGAFASGSGPERRVREAMMAHPVMVGRPCVNVMSAAPGRIVAKAGAEGVYLIGLPASGVGIALKAVDGAARPLLHVLAALLRKLRLLSKAELDVLAKSADPVIRNHAGLEVGEIRVSKV
ncbi:MAG TPA: asparaginase [Planctomycetota bacterium]